MSIKVLPVIRSQEAADVPYDNSVSGLSSEDVQGAIDELANGVGGNSASPGFTFGRSGNVNTNTWLLNDTVPSNLTGRGVPLNSAVIVEFFVSSQASDTYTLGLYSHDGNSINLALLDTISIVASRGDTKIVSIAIAKNKQLAMKVTSGSCNNVVAGVIVRGVTT
jgi:hypothetical protein